jgi:hypothetical protein
MRKQKNRLTATKPQNRFARNFTMRAQIILLDPLSSMVVVSLATDACGGRAGGLKLAPG